MPSDRMLRDVVTLVKPDGTKYEGLKASVQSKMIFSSDPSIPIEEGDIFERKRGGTGLTDRYRVLDAGFYERMGGISAHYQTKVEKLNQMDSRTQQQPRISDRTPPEMTKVFLVHGHDNEMKESVARIVSKIGLQPIILHEQPNQGKTIIEKFERDADVGFAIALLSPDDMAYTATSDPSSANPRARQNVVLELGYFVGKIGRDRVMALKRSGLEVPSDFSGVVYTEYDDAGNWRFELVRELKAAGFNVDANELL